MNTQEKIKEYILSKCVKQKKERVLLPQVTRKFGITNGITQQYIHKLKSDGLLCVPEKNTLKAIQIGGKNEK